LADMKLLEEEGCIVLCWVTSSVNSQHPAVALFLGFFHLCLLSEFLFSVI